jgi:hypothetical protein
MSPAKLHCPEKPRWSHGSLTLVTMSKRLQPWDCFRFWRNILGRHVLKNVTRKTGEAIELRDPGETI